MGETATAPPRPDSGAPHPPGRAQQLLSRLEWTVLRRLDGMIEGDYRTLFRGHGMDLADLREYQLHDDVRHIDWNVTARTQTPYVRQYQQERELTAWFLLDLSPSIDFGSHERSKRDLLDEFVAVMSSLLARRGNRVGAVFYGQQVDAIVPARSGRQHVLQLMHRLLGLGRSGARLDRTHGTDLRELLERANALARRRSVVFVVSDFISEPGWIDTLGRLGLRHDVVVVRVVDPLERELPDLGMVVMQDAETGDQVVVDTHDAGFRQRFEQAAQAQEDRLRLAFGDAGVDVLELSCDEDLVAAMRRFIGLRKLRARQAAGGGAVQTAAGRSSRDMSRQGVEP